jgi:DNA-binding NarL/FixJ family response regulator
VSEVSSLAAGKCAQLETRAVSLLAPGENGPPQDGLIGLEQGEQGQRVTRPSQRGDPVKEPLDSSQRTSEVLRIALVEGMSIRRISCRLQITRKTVHELLGRHGLQDLGKDATSKRWSSG